MKIVVGEKVSRKGVELLRQESKWRIVETEPARDKLLPELKDADALIIRSAIKADAQLLEMAPRLQVIGRAGIGVDNVDVDAATRKGVLVMNTPGGNAVSVAEHTLALMLALARSVPQANESMHAGRWEKKLFEGRELQGKTLGIMGLGRIGIEVVKRAHALQMDIFAYDPYVSAAVAGDLNVKLVSIDDLLERSDYLSLHMPGTSETTRMVGKDFIKKMKKGACIINCARGELIDEEALADAVRSGHLAGAALDVFAPEPPKNSPLLALPQVILTPHIAGSTAEAQEAVGLRIAEQVRDYLKSGVIQNAVNVPAIPVDEYRILRPYLDLGERLGLFLAQVASGPATEVEIRYAGKLAKMNTNLVRNSVLKGLLNPVLAEEKANLVNAVSIAEDRGIRIEETRNQRTQFTDSIRVALKSDGQVSSVEGTILHGSEPRLVVLDNINVECPLDGSLIVLKNQDVPGVVGKIGTILGRSGNNIANFSLGRERAAKRKSKTPVEAVAVVQVDGEITEKVLQELSRVPAMRFVRAVHFG